MKADIPWPGAPVNVLLLTTNLEDNSTGRAFALWLMARNLGWTVAVVAAAGDRMWAPLEGSLFAKDALVLKEDVPDDMAELQRRASAAQLIVAVKPLPGSLDRADALSRSTGTPMLIDIDDPDLEDRLSRHDVLRRVAKTVLRPATSRKYRQLSRIVRRYPRMVSNPVLARRYGGEIVPHAREDVGVGSPHVSFRPRVAFVGTMRGHKGVGTLRAAVASLQGQGVSLTVTDDAPADAHPWERWLGQTSFDAGMKLVAQSDIVVVPSSGRHHFSHAQLPAKLVDAMILGRAIVVSDLEPMTWALGGAGLVARPDDPDALADCIADLRDPERRSELGARARVRALEVFSVEQASARFYTACLRTGAVSATEQGT